MLYLVILPFFKYAYHFYFSVISTFIRKISKESYTGIYYEKQDPINAQGRSAEDMQSVTLLWAKICANYNNTS